MKQLIFTLLLLLFATVSQAAEIGYSTETRDVDNFMNAVARCFPIDPSDITTSYQIDSISIFIYDSDDGDNYCMLGLYNDQGGPFGPADLLASSDSFLIPQNPGSDDWSDPDATLSYTLTASTQYWIGAMSFAGDGVDDNDAENVVTSAGGFRDSCYQSIDLTVANRTFDDPAVVNGASDGRMNVKVWVTDVATGAQKVIGGVVIGKGVF